MLQFRTNAAPVHLGARSLEEHPDVVKALVPKAHTDPLVIHLQPGKPPRNNGQQKIDPADFTGESPTENQEWNAVLRSKKNSPPNIRNSIWKLLHGGP